MIANICLFCHDPDYIWKPRDQDQKLKCVSHDKGKSGYSCQSQSCKQRGTVNGAEEYEAKNANAMQENIVETKSPKKLKLQRKKMMTKLKGEETAQVKEVKSDFKSPGTAPIVADPDQNSLFMNQVMKELTKMNANDRILFSKNTIPEDQMFTMLKEWKT